MASLQSQAVVTLHCISQFVYSAGQSHERAFTVLPLGIMLPNYRKSSITIELWQNHVFVVVAVAADGLVPLNPERLET